MSERPKVRGTSGAGCGESRGSGRRRGREKEAEGEEASRNLQGPFCSAGAARRRRRERGAEQRKRRAQPAACVSVQRQSAQQEGGRGDTPTVAKPPSPVVLARAPLPLPVRAADACDSGGQRPGRNPRQQRGCGGVQAAPCAAGSQAELTSVCRPVCCARGKGERGQGDHGGGSGR